MLAACGGGGGNGSTPTQAETTGGNGTTTPNGSTGGGISSPSPDSGGSTPPSGGGSGTPSTGGTDGNSSSPPADAFAAQLVSAPPTSDWLGADRTTNTISNTVYFEVSGTGLGNVELVSAKDPSIVYGRFTISADKTRATLEWNYRNVNNWAYGAFELRILAWDVPPGASGRMIEVMEARRYLAKLPLSCQGEGTCGGEAP